MRKKFANTKVGSFLTKTATGKLLVGTADTVTGGLVSNLVESTETHPAGNLDKIKAIGVVLTGILLIYLVVTGQITIGEAQELKELTE